MEPLPGWGSLPWSPVPQADVLSLVLCFLLLGRPHCTLAIPLCTEEEFPAMDQCCPKCRPGYHVKEPCGVETGTVCAPCALGTYTAHLNGLSECLQCRVCDPAMGLMTRQNCSSRKNTVCSCGQGHFCVTERGDDCAECRPHSVCRPGQRVQERGTDRSDTVCADCPPETFSPSGSLEECQPWTKCSDRLRVEVSQGTNSTDATCSSWPLWVLLGFLAVGFCIPLSFLVIKCRKSPGQGTKRSFRPQDKTLRSKKEATADQVLQASQHLPDVTTEAVEETASMFLRKDRPTDEWLQDTND